MAQRVQVLLVDDIDGRTADETVTFALDGVAYEIDLTNENAMRLREALNRWIGGARRVSGRARRGQGRRPSGNSQTARIREWAKAHGYEVSDRGRIAADIRAAYDAAN
ncbi:MAG: Lsr2 family protein [Bifidobacteriaceae bacterium]|jgi:hypothetical protein|nr:Lsr2 family protein [Bifidobacteriaceae bacterium]